jgi:hypothetical protein
MFKIHKRCQNVQLHYIDHDNLNAVTKMHETRHNTRKFGVVICSLVLLGSSPTIETYMKEAQYYYLKYICNYLQNMIW